MKIIIVFFKIVILLPLSFDIKIAVLIHQPVYNSIISKIANLSNFAK